MMQTSKYFSFVLSISGINSGFFAIVFSKRLFGKEDFEATLFLLLRLTIYAFPHLEGSKQPDATTNWFCVKNNFPGVLFYFTFYTSVFLY